MPGAKASMATKCVAQIPEPPAKAATTNQSPWGPAPDLRAWRSRARVVAEASAQIPPASATKRRSCAPTTQSTTSNIGDLCPRCSAEDCPAVARILLLPSTLAVHEQSRTTRDGG